MLAFWKGLLQEELLLENIHRRPRPCALYTKDRIATEAISRQTRDLSKVGRQLERVEAAQTINFKRFIYFRANKHSNVFRTQYRLLIHIFYNCTHLHLCVFRIFFCLSEINTILNNTNNEHYKDTHTHTRIFKQLCLNATVKCNCDCISKMVVGNIRARCSVVKRFAYKSLDPYGGTTRRREIEKSSRAQPGPSFAAAPITNPR